MCKNRCPWTGNNPLMIKYHDEEWAVAVHNDKIHFEFILLDAFQAGLSWQTIINKRENFKDAFDEFDYMKIEGNDTHKVNELMENAGSIRNKLKIQAAIKNAESFIRIQQEFGSFDAFIWQFVGGKPIMNQWKSMHEIPTHTIQSDAMSKALQKRGFKFVGTTICYAYMQAAGMVNDHLVDCFRYLEIKNQVVG